MRAQDEPPRAASEPGPPSYLGDEDIPPAIACARCGNPSCEGCSKDEELEAPPPGGPSALPWEDPERRFASRLVETAELSAVRPDIAFGRLGAGRISEALWFALWCELVAVGSFTIVWGLGFYAAFPFVARQMLSSPAVLILVGSILFGLTLFVVFVHALWGVGLEWGIARAGGKADMNRGLRFGFYACGWDLLTSPAGVWSQWRRVGFVEGVSHLRAATRAPRASLRAYLDDCRKVTEREKKSAMWTSILLGLGGVAAAGFLLFAGLLVAWLPWIF